jgi:hypothetical protein
VKMWLMVGGGRGEGEVGEGGSLMNCMMTVVEQQGGVSTSFSIQRLVKLVINGELKDCDILVKLRSVLRNKLTVVGIDEGKLEG